MTRRTSFSAALICLLVLVAREGQSQPASTASVSAIPHLEKRGLATQLIVDGRPFLVLGAEPPTSAPSNLVYLKYMMQVMAETHQNTGAMAIGWNWVEPQKGKFDFKILDAMIEDAAQIDQRICLVWFGSWKNGVSGFAPAWVKADQDTFPRAQVVDAKTKVMKTAEALSAFGQNNWEADALALAAVMRHIREVDRSHRVILVQVENEIGIFGDSRDRSELANKAFAAPVPAELMDYLTSHKEGLHPDLRKVWEAAGGKTSGTWDEVFGKNPQADEIFMAWSYARYVESRHGGRQEGIPAPHVRQPVGNDRLGEGPARRGLRPRPRRLGSRRPAGRFLLP